MTDFVGHRKQRHHQASLPAGPGKSKLMAANQCYQIASGQSIANFRSPCACAPVHWSRRPPLSLSIGHRRRLPPRRRRRQLFLLLMIISSSFVVLSMASELNKINNHLPPFPAPPILVDPKFTNQKNSISLFQQQEQSTQATHNQQREEQAIQFAYPFHSIPAFPPPQIMGPEMRIGPLNGSGIVSAAGDEGSQFWSSVAAPHRLKRRHRRHVVTPPNGSVQAQEVAKRKAASGAAGQSQSRPTNQQANNNNNNNNNKRQVIYAMLKGQVVIPCNLEPPEQDDTVSLVLWYKDKSMVPIYSVDARSSPIQEARHKPGPWLEGRSKLKIVGGPQTPTKVRRKRGASQVLATSHNRHHRHRKQHSTTTTTTTRARRSGREVGAQEAPDDEDYKDYAAEAEVADETQAGRADAQASLQASRAQSRKRNRPATIKWQQQQAPSTPTSPQRLGWHRIVELGGGGGPQSGAAGPMAFTSSNIQQKQQQLVAHLYVDSLSSEDNGLYSCRVDFRKARSRTQETLLRIIVPADKPVVRDLTSGDGQQQQQQLQDSLQLGGHLEDQHQQQPISRPPTLAAGSGDASVQIVGPHNEGARLVLQCETQGGYPEPMLTWWRNGRLLDDSYELVSASDGLVVSRHAGLAHQQQQPQPMDTSGEQGGGAAAASTADELQLLTVAMFRLRAKLVGDPNELMDSLTLHQQQQQHDDDDGQQEGEQLANGLAGDSLGAGAIEMMAQAAAASDEQPFLGASSSSSSVNQLDGAGGIPSKTEPHGIANNNNKQVQNRLIRNRLELRALTRADLLANYSCQAWNTKLGDPPATSIMIDMNLRPIKVQIDNERLPVLADQPLEIVCRAFGSRPAALISWWRGNTRLVPGNELNPTSGQGNSKHQQQQQHRQLRSDGDTSSQLLQLQLTNSVQIQESVSTDSNITSSSLTMVPKLEDGGQIISCRAENPYMQQIAGNSLEDSWKLEVHYLPRVKLALGEKLHHQGLIREGHDVYFECSVKALPLAREIRWWFNGRELETNVSSGVIISNQSLVLQRVNRHQRGRYTCSAVNSVGESHSNSVHLRVQYAPFCRDQSSSSSPPEAGSSSGSNIMATNYHRQQQQQQQEEPNGNGDINRINVADTNTLLLPDTEGPFTAISQQRFKTHYGASRMESVRVYCHIDADPIESISYKWAFVATLNGAGNTTQLGQSQVGTAGGRQQRQHPVGGGGGGTQFSGQQLVYLDPSSITSLAPDSPLVSVATYTPRSELDYGTLLCWGQNSLGQQAEPCAYQIVPAERPDSLRNCRLVNASDIQLTVACEPGYDGGIDQSFQMEVYDSSKHELVANITTSLSSLNGGDISLHSSNDNDSSPQDFISSNNNNGSMSNSESGGSVGPASLVSGGEQVFGTRQQKQRHSGGSHHNSAAPSPQPSSPSSIADKLQASSSSNRQHNLETLFVTEPNLRPATHYFLSIYSTNSKGSSKPVAFTASTMNLTGSPDTVGGAEIGSTSAVSSRDGRRSIDPSHLLSDVLALSWSPFLLICATTVALFIMFASITFAMMKYVDFSATFPSLSAQTTSGGSTSSSSGYGPCLPMKEPRGASGGTNSRGGSNKSPRSRFELGSGDSSSNKNNNNSDNTDNENDCGRDDSGANGLTMAGQRARVITVASTANNGVHTHNSVHLNHNHHNRHAIQHHTGAAEILVGQPANPASSSSSSSLLNGSYLKFRIQQLTGQANTDVAAVAGGRLKQSNSDNFLNQMSNQNLQLNEQQPRQSALVPQISANGTMTTTTTVPYCGTLPKNGPATLRVAMARQSESITFQHHRNSSSFTNQQQQQHHPDQVQMRDFESPYGPRRLPDTYSCSSATGSASVQQQQQLTSLVLAAAATTGDRPAFSGSNTSGHQAPLLPLPLLPAPPPPSSSSSSSLGDRRVEQLVISGKQYIHQTSAPSRRPSFLLQQQQQRQSPTARQPEPLLHRQQHLQLTSNYGPVAPYGSLERQGGANHLYGTVAKGATRQQQHQLQLAGQDQEMTGSELVCMAAHQQQPSTIWHQQHQHQHSGAGAEGLELSSGQLIGLLANGNSLESQSCIGGYGTTHGGPIEMLEDQTAANDGQTQQQRPHDDLLTSENYQLPASCAGIGSDRNNSIVHISNNNDTIGANPNNKTNDLTASAHTNEPSQIGGPEDQLLRQSRTTLEGTNGLCNHAAAHLTLVVAGRQEHLAPVSGVPNSNNLDTLGNGGGGSGGAIDSDGCVSSGTHRSLANTLTTTGSPSSGTMETETDQLLRHNLVHGFNNIYHQLKTQPPPPPPPIISATSSSSTIASSSDLQVGTKGFGPSSSANESFGNVISLAPYSSSSTCSSSNGLAPDARCMMAQASLRRGPRTSPGASGIRQAKKNQQQFNQVTKYETDLLHEFDPEILDQCTMFVDGNEFHLTDVNNNLIGQQQFYVLPADELDRFAATQSTKARVRLVGINGDNHQTNSDYNDNHHHHHHLHQGPGGTSNRSPNININHHNTASGGCHRTTVNGNGNQPNGSELHTDV